MSRGRSFAIGLFAGGMVGWVLGILSAPRSGKETLEALGDRAIELRSKAEETADRMREGMFGALNSTTGLNEDYTR
ncbi:MAG: YtxH domain-containing protein [Chloroflexi bacterium]|nr:YtxH domain-containing protein [Chloroflexota bacterium]